MDFIVSSVNLPLFSQIGVILNVNPSTAIRYRTSPVDCSLIRKIAYEASHFFADCLQNVLLEQSNCTDTFLYTESYFIVVFGNVLIPSLEETCAKMSFSLELDGKHRCGGK